MITSEEYRNNIKARYAKRQASSLSDISNNNLDYTEEEDAIILADNGMTILEKAAKLSRSYAAVSGRRRRLLEVINDGYIKTWRRGSRRDGNPTKPRGTGAKRHERQSNTEKQN